MSNLPDPDCFFWPPRKWPHLMNLIWSSFTRFRDATENNDVVLFWELRLLDVAKMPIMIFLFRNSQFAIKLVSTGFCSGVDNIISDDRFDTDRLTAFHVYQNVKMNDLRIYWNIEEIINSWNFQSYVCWEFHRFYIWSCCLVDSRRCPKRRYCLYRRTFGTLASWPHSSTGKPRLVLRLKRLLRYCNCN